MESFASAMSGFEPALKGAGVAFEEVIRVISSLLTFLALGAILSLN